MKRLLFFYSHFSPAYKAGGPVQSLANLAEVLAPSFLIDIVCGIRDLGEKEKLQGVRGDTWNSLNSVLSVFFVDRSGARRLNREIDRRRPDVFYINGMFLPFYSWLPLVLGRVNGIPVVLAPRGMLQQGAIAGNFFMKRLSIIFLKSLGLLKDVTWHATDEQERADIRTYFGSEASIHVVGNVPKQPMKSKTPVSKAEGELRLVFLSVIARKKNLDFVLRILKDIQQPISLDIYGPIKDVLYWEECSALISDQPHSVRYMGPVKPQDVQETFGRYHAMILLTKGENFGHAIYEALSTGTPAIISQYTPWGRLEAKNAGMTLDIHDYVSCRAGIEAFGSLGQLEFDKLSHGAFELARDYYTGCDFGKLYTKMFDAAIN